jgi:hypothetical protein
MKKSVLFTFLLIICAGCQTVYSGHTIKGPLPETFPGPEKCAACHKISQTSEELKQSGHEDLQCLDCHIPGVVQKEKYKSKNISFERLGYHKQKGNWVEAKENEVCLRCHAENGIEDTKDKCWSCHMSESGSDNLVFVKDKRLPPNGDNIKSIKKLPHKSHNFKVHSKMK